MCACVCVWSQAEFLREAEIMLEFNHPNLVQLIGVAVQQRPWLSVLEYMKVRRPASCRAVPELIPDQQEVF